MFRCVQTFPNWEDIKTTLTRLADKQLKAEEIVKTITAFRGISQMARQEMKAGTSIATHLQALFLQYKHKLPDVYSKVAKFLLARPQMAIPLIVSGKEGDYTLTKEQILYLFSTMVLCLIPQQEFDSQIKHKSRYSYLMDFSCIFEEHPDKTPAVIEYIDSEIDKVESYGQTFVIRRRVEKRKIEEIIKENENSPMAEIKLEGDEVSIEDYYGHLKADFANKYLGGGALTYGCVQEEIMFVNHPQLWTMEMLCEVMEPNEAIQLMGFKKYFKNAGYGYNFTFDGKQPHEYEYSETKMAKEYIAAIDALAYGHGNIHKQFSKEDINREILKAFVGFSTDIPDIKSVATGNWGCGAFRGDLRLKFLVQWLACSLAKKEMIYCPFGESKVLYDEQIISKVKKQTIGQVYKNILNAAEEVIKSEHSNIYDKLL